MSPDEIVQEIKRLPRGEQLRVVELAREFIEIQPYSPEELEQLADRMVEMPDAEEAGRLQQDLVRGFFGASSAPDQSRRKLSPPLLENLLFRVRQRTIAPEEVELLARWLDAKPRIPTEKWFRAFEGFFVCGEGEAISTLQFSRREPEGQELE